MTRRIFRRRSGLSLTDLLVVVALIPLISVVVISCRRHGGETAWRVRCSSNLRQIGQAITLYAMENRGALPRTTFSGGAEVTPVFGTGAEAKDPFKSDGPEPNDVTAAFFLLLRTQEIESEVFVCPRKDGNRDFWDFGGSGKTAKDWSNWPRDICRKHVGYSFANPYPDDYAAKSKLNTQLSADFAVAADLNPGVIKDKSNVLAITSTSSAKDMKQGNSLNHDGDGQNVLYGDGHVDFQQNPFVGVNRDNIYARRAASTGFASAPLPLARSPYDVNDSVLLPYAE